MIIRRLAAGGAAPLFFFSSLFFFPSPVRRGSIRVKRGRRPQLRPGKPRPVRWQPRPPPPSAFSVILPASERRGMSGRGAAVKLCCCHGPRCACWCLSYFLRHPRVFFFHLCYREAAGVRNYSVITASVFHSGCLSANSLSNSDKGRKIRSRCRDAF